jgi:hypothetical protein
VARAILDRAFVFGVIFGVFDAFGLVLLGTERRCGILADRLYRGVQRVVRIGTLPSRPASLAFVRVVMVFLLPVICHEWTCPAIDERKRLRAPDTARKPTRLPRTQGPTGSEPARQAARSNAPWRSRRRRPSLVCADLRHDHRIAQPVREAERTHGVHRIFPLDALTFECAPDMRNPELAGALAVRKSCRLCEDMLQVGTKLESLLHAATLFQTACAEGITRITTAFNAAPFLLSGRMRPSRLSAQTGRTERTGHSLLIRYDVSPRRI